MIQFDILLKKFADKGEKTGWVYIEIASSWAEILNPGVRISYRVKGRIDQYPISQLALLPMGDGSFILPANAGIRRKIGKEQGDKVRVELSVDSSPVALSSDLLICLEDDPRALDHFNSLSKGHQNYFSKWIESAKTTETKVRRISQAVHGLALGMDYGQMIRYFRDKA
jgi:hypothetical protein